MEKTFAETASQSNFGESATVRFNINECDTVAQVYPLNWTIGNILDDIAPKFQLLPKYVSLRRDKFAPRLLKSVQLSQLCRNDFFIVDVQMGLSDLANQINDGIKNPYEKIRLDTDLYYRHFRLPDFISVTIPDAENASNFKRLVVEIINDPIVKPFLGGYYNRLTGIEYHHAYSQTGPPKELLKYSGRVTRDTQTIEHGLFNIRQTANPNESKSSDIATNDIERHNGAMVIQRNFRWYLWRKLIKQSAHDSRQKNASRVHIHIAPIRDDNTMKARADFTAAKMKIQKWKENELEVAKKRFTNNQTKKQQEFARILQEEIRLLNEIERKRNETMKVALEEQKEQHLIQLGEPVKWIGYKNIKCEMDSLECQRIRRLTTLYQRLKAPASTNERIEFITELADALKSEPHSPLLNELIDLLGREQKLLIANIDKDNMVVLHNRQNELFRNFIKATKIT